MMAAIANLEPAPTLLEHYRRADLGRVRKNIVSLLLVQDSEAFEASQRGHGVPEGVGRVLADALDLKTSIPLYLRRCRQALSLLAWHEVSRH